MKITLKGIVYDVELLHEIDRIKGNWGIWACQLVAGVNGPILEGSIQTDTHMCAPETFEED